MLDQVKIGSKIKELRISQNITQENLATTLFVTRQAVSRWEQGLALPTVDNIITLTSLLHTTFDEILCLNEPILINQEDIFSGHSRAFVIESIINRKINLNLGEYFYLFSKKERMVILRAVKEKRIKIDMSEFIYYLTKVELEYLGSENRKDDTYVTRY